MTHSLDPSTPDQTQAAQLAHLAEEIIATKLCPELAAQATQLVLGDGNPNADIVFVGEAPGKNEDLQGKPFVGAAGKFLDEMLATAGLVRSDVYITNIVKYRPPNNRDPLPEEKRAFWPYLMQQLDIIQPKAVLTLGRHSGGGFIPDLRISRDHGQPRKVRLHEREFVVIPLYHPATVPCARRSSTTSSGQWRMCGRRRRVNNEYCRDIARRIVSHNQQERKRQVLCCANEKR